MVPSHEPVIHCRAFPASLDSLTHRSKAAWAAPPRALASFPNTKEKIPFSGKELQTCRNTFEYLWIKGCGLLSKGLTDWRVLLYFKKMGVWGSKNSTIEFHSLPRSKVVKLAPGDRALEHTGVGPGTDVLTSCTWGDSRNLSPWETWTFVDGFWLQKRKRKNLRPVWHLLNISSF